jgi:NTP pyrophosphatase (non-canonical NTP hydrolase)
LEGAVITFVDYQSKTHETAIYPGQGNINGLLYTTLGLVGEAGEVANRVKKCLRDDDGKITPEFIQVIGKELGDILWYCSQTCTELGIDFGDVAHFNLVKLADRKTRGVLTGSGDNR